MIDWSFLERVVIGDLRPHLVDEGSSMLDEIITRIKSNKLRTSLNNLIDISYPAPYSIKTEAYYEFIKTETEIIKNELQKLSIDVLNIDELQYKVKNQLRFALKLLDDANTYKRENVENFREVFFNENAHASGCIYTYFDLVMDELLLYYGDIAPKEFLFAYYEPKRLKSLEVYNKLEALKIKKKVNSTELFQLNINSRENEFIAMLYSFFKESGFIDSSYSIFERHFFQTKEEFKRITWKKNIPLLKHVFLHLIHKKILQEPRINLDFLLSEHFFNKKGEYIDRNYLSQATARLQDTSPQLVQLYKNLQGIISNFSSNII